jgi:hypothetical protein
MREASTAARSRQPADSCPRPDGCPSEARAADTALLGDALHSCGFCGRTRLARRLLKAHAVAARSVHEENLMTTKLAIISALLLATSSAVAEDVSTHATLPAASLSMVTSTTRVDDADVPRRDRLIEHHGFYGAPTLGVTMLDGQAAPLIGMRTAWLANRTWGLGMAVNAMGNELDEELHYVGRGFGVYGGLLLQYVVGSSHRVHGFVDTTFGGGVICQQNGSSGTDDCVGRSFLALEPTANLEINIFSAMRVAIGVGYRVAVASEDSPLSSHDLSGVVSKAALQFGKF